MIKAAKPMIDLLMLLLLLLSGQQMATTMPYQDISMTEEALTDIESKNDNAAANQLQRISCDLLSDGALSLDGNNISVSDLVEKARAERAAKVYLRIAEDVSYARIREVIRELSDNGLSIELS